MIGIMRASLQSHAAAKSNISRAIDAAESLAKGEISEHRLIGHLSTELDRFRGLYRYRRTEFDRQDVRRLKDLANAEQRIRDFVDILGEIPGVKTQDDCQDLISWLDELTTSLPDWKVAQRLAKEIRELRERAASLPRQAALAAESKHNHQLALLQEQGTKPCPRCGSQMVVRVGPYGCFWGCTTFPRCFGTLRLSKKHLSILAGTITA